MNGWPLDIPYSLLQTYVLACLKPVTRGCYIGLLIPTIGWIHEFWVEESSLVRIDMLFRIKRFQTLLDTAEAFHRLMNPEIVNIA